MFIQKTCQIVRLNYRYCKIYIGEYNKMKRSEERFKDGLMELAISAKLGLINYLSSNSTELMDKSIEKGTIFCDTFTTMINMRKNFDGTEEAYKRLFSEFDKQRDIDLDLFYLGEDFIKSLRNKGYNLEKVLTLTQDARKKLEIMHDKVKSKSFTDINKNDVEGLYNYFEEYMLFVGSTLPDSFEETMRAREKYYGGM